ncbi:type 2 periplasmic-binding domain-containing protein [Kordiimonas pumila]|uniref:Solute-binding protein family 3/N-terminal domain-containing protein n=1 Tax=Kordiimonas pumila TaxID=2161677 RepID=A0ABV7D2E5_9PROT|nr:hypothetical protein [Kordiimonas pumila]
MKNIIFRGIDSLLVCGVCFTIAFLLGALPAYSGEKLSVTPESTIKISGASVKGLLHSEYKGPYNQVLDIIEAGYEGKLLLTMRPVKRASISFFAHESDCIFFSPTDRDYYTARNTDVDFLVMSKPVNTVSVRAYTVPGDSMVRSAADLEERTFAAEVAMGGSDFFRNYDMAAGKEVISVFGVETAFKLLDQGRVSAVVAADYDVERYFKLAGSPVHYRYDERFVLYKAEDAFVCWRTPITEAFIQHIDLSLSIMEESGQLHGILSGYSTSAVDGGGY